MATNLVSTNISRGRMSRERDRAALTYIKDAEGASLRDMGLIRDRWVQWFSSLLKTKLSTLDPGIVEELKVWPPCTPLDDLPSIFEEEETIESMSIVKRLLDSMSLTLNCSNSP